MSSLGHVDASSLCNETQLNGCISSAVDNDSLTDSVSSLPWRSSSRDQRTLLNLVINAVKNGNRLLGSADHTVIEGLGVANDGIYCKLDIYDIVDDNGVLPGPT